MLGGVLRRAVHRTRTARPAGPERWGLSPSGVDAARLAPPRPAPRTTAAAAALELVYFLLGRLDAARLASPRLASARLGSPRTARQYLWASAQCLAFSLKTRILRPGRPGRSKGALVAALPALPRPGPAWRPGGPQSGLWIFVAKARHLALHARVHAPALA